MDIRPDLMNRHPLTRQKSGESLLKSAYNAGKKFSALIKTATPTCWDH
jgi:hypothetical protein